MDANKFIEFVTFMGLIQSKRYDFINGNTVIYFEGESIEHGVFTCRGYDTFLAGILFNSTGEIIKSFIDSHVADRSENLVFIDNYVHINQV